MLFKESKSNAIQWDKTIIQITLKAFWFRLYDAALTLFLSLVCYTRKGYACSWGSACKGSSKPKENLLIFF